MTQVWILRLRSRGECEIGVFSSEEAAKAAFLAWANDGRVANKRDDFDKAVRLFEGWTTIDLFGPLSVDGPMLERDEPYAPDSEDDEVVDDGMSNWSDEERAALDKLLAEQGQK